MSVFPGHERPTLAEQFVSLFRLPYPAGCIVIAFLLGPASQLLWRILSGFNLSEAYAHWVGTFFATQIDVISYAAWLSAVAYTFYIVRYVRKKVLMAEGSLSPLLPNGENDFHRLFGGISARKGQVTTWAVIFAVLMTDLRFLTAGPVPLLAYYIVSRFILSLEVACALWAVLSSLKGIHTMGLVSLQLSSYQTDHLLGLRPVGSLAFSLSLAYFGGIFLNALGIIPRDAIYFLGVVTGSVLLGLLMFFLPMLRFHRVMTRFKHQEMDRLRHRQEEFLKDRTGVPAQANVDMLLLDMTERKVSSISTWPFDMQILGKLFALASTVLGILLSLLSLF